MTDASTTLGTSSFLSPTGTSETGHAGDGYVRITVIKAKNSAIFKKSNGVWKEITDSIAGKFYDFNGFLNVSQKQLIEFYLNYGGEPSLCQAEEGMTWYEWINSSYFSDLEDTFGIYCDSSNSVVHSFDQWNYVRYQGENVYGNELIVDQREYMVTDLMLDI